MKNKLFVFFVVLIIIVVTTILMIRANSNEIKIEDPIVKYNDKEISVVKTDFRYNSRLRRKYNYYVDAYDVINNIEAMQVLPNAELEILFNHVPEAYYIFKLLDNGNHEMVHEVNDVKNAKDNEIFKFIVPDTSGKYVYSICSNYEEGVGIYYFAVDVQTNN